MQELTTAAEVAAKLKERNVILEAYPGWGKTRLAGELAGAFKKVLVVERTLEEIYELLRMSKAKLIPLYGKERVCPLWKRGSDYSVYAFCERMRILNRCPYKYKADGKFVRWLAAFPRYPKDIVERAKQSGYCPYPSVLALSGSPRVVTTYAFYLVRPDLTEGREAVIFDESHEMLNAILGMVVHVDETYVSTNVEALKGNLETRSLAYFVRRCWQKSNSGRDFVECLERAPAGPASIIDVLVNAYHSRRCRAEGKELWCLTSKPTFSATGNLFMSAYLPPFLLKVIPNAEVIRVEPSEGAISAVIDDELTSRYDERSDELYKAYAEKLAQYYADNVAQLAVFPSYDFMKKVMRYLPEGVSAKVKGPDAIRDAGPGDIIFDVAGGRATEGVNPSESLRRVIVVGLPYPPPSGPMNLLADIYGFDETYTYVALLKVVQALGRLRLRPGASAVLMDRRYRRVVDFMPSFIAVS